VIATRTLSSTRCSRRNDHNRSPPPPFRKHFGYVPCEFKYHKTNKTKVVINAATVIEGLMLSGGPTVLLGRIAGVSRQAISQVLKNDTE
jgi:hypothetical protein